MYSERLLPVLVCLFLTACGSLPAGPGKDSNRQAFIDALAAEPSVCGQYRSLYVQGFKANVAALSSSDPVLKSRATALLKRSNELLASADLGKEACSRPYCIIEPLQGGQLDSWCGYRLPADTGAELYQWLNWSQVRDSASSP